MKIDQAKKVLKDNGYFIDNLWQIEDVKSIFKCNEDEAQEVLTQALQNEATMNQIWFAIRLHGEENELEENNLKTTTI